MSLAEDLIRDEGLRLKPYVDTVGKLTIGIGRNLSDVGITEAEARFMLANDIESAWSGLHSIAPWYTELPRPAQDVLCNMCLNMGPTRLAGFRDFLAALRNSRWDVAAAEMLDSRWASQVGARAERLAAVIRGLK